MSQTTIIKSSPASILLTSPHTIIPQKLHLTKNGTIKLDPTKLIHNLPPTPPSSGSSGEDSEDNGPMSQPSSPVQRKTSTTAARLLVSNHHHTTTRQPINTPLISSQPVSFNNFNPSIISYCFVELTFYSIRSNSLYQTTFWVKYHKTRKLLSEVKIAHASYFHDLWSKATGARASPGFRIGGFKKIKRKYIK